ncbi:MAG: twin-arginine translocation pathway signal protein [Acetobacteraceae bacterium]|nr:twin-arginine translocation pathway signal protein [Acetobacteraceae bacterium]
MDANRATRRATLAALAAAAGSAGGCRRATAQQPTVDRIARLVVGFPPGGSSDTVSRLYAERLRGLYAPQIVVENRAGAGGRLALEAVKAARPDGTTLVQTPASMLTVYPHIYPKTLRYDALADFVPVTPVCAFPFALAVRPDHPAKAFPEFVAWAKRQGGAVPFASPAAGAVPHFLGVQMAKATGLQLTHVPYRGAAPAIQDLIAGQIPMVVVVAGEVAEFHRAGQVRILAMSSPERVPRLPDAPTFSELGHPDLTTEEWFGVLLPAGTPAPLVEGLHRAIGAAAATPELQEALARLEYRTAMMDPRDFAARIRAERERWGPIVQESGFKAEE